MKFQPSLVGLSWDIQVIVLADGFSLLIVAAVLPPVLAVHDDGIEWSENVGHLDFERLDNRRIHH